MPCHAKTRSGRTNARGGPLVQANHHELGDYWLVCQGTPELLFTENESNAQRLWGVPNRTPYVKDGIGEAVVDGHNWAVNPARVGTKAAAHYQFRDRSRRHRDRSSCGYRSERHRRAVQRRRDGSSPTAAPKPMPSTQTLAQGRLTEDEARVQRQALAGLIWSKQVFNFDVAQWLDGDPAGPPPPEARKHGRNSQWRHHNSSDVISMPDKWEYPWYAAWDLAFHCVAFGLVDPGFAKEQLLLMLREWYMHPNGQIPAYEWAFGDVNPPVHIAGGPGDLSGRATTHRRRRPRLPGPGLPQAPAQLHLVGQP